MHLMGRQILAELCFCPEDRLDDVAGLQDLMVSAAEQAGATVIGVEAHRFEPQGVSCVVIVQESHLAIHTWPELGYAAVDVFTCGDHISTERAVQVISEGIQAGNMTTFQINRGIQLEGHFQGRPDGAPAWTPPPQHG